MAYDSHKDLIEDGARCRITNRIREGIHTLKMGSVRLGYDGGASFVVGDFRPITTDGLEEHFLADKKMGPEPEVPDSAM